MYPDTLHNKQRRRIEERKLEFQCAAVLVGQMDEGHLVGHEVAVHVLYVHDYGGGVGDDDADVRRPLVLPDPKNLKK